MLSSLVAVLAIACFAAMVGMIGRVLWLQVRTGKRWLQRARFDMTVIGALLLATMLLMTIAGALRDQP